jgi:hypothetical protein
MLVFRVHLNNGLALCFRPNRVCCRATRCMVKDAATRLHTTNPQPPDLSEPAQNDHVAAKHRRRVVIGGP